jgi:hypothetical protein
MKTRTTLAPSASVHWAQEKDFVLLVDEQNGKSQSLRGSEASVWNWLTLGYAHSRIIHLLTAVLDENPDDAKSKLNGILLQWREQGWLENGHG